MTSFVDSHCHLTNPAFNEDTEAVVLRAQKAGVRTMLSVATDLNDSQKVLALAHKYEGVFCSQGVHPHEAQRDSSGGDEEALKKKLEASLEDPKVVALGETGLDYYYNHSPEDIQQDVLKCHIELHKKTRLPLIIHSREAEKDLLNLFEEMDVGVSEGYFPGVIHSFSGSFEFAHQCLQRGFYISASGISTFKNAQDLRDVFKTIPLERLLIETDAPYLAPPPYRGKRNEPMYVCEVAQVLATLHGVSLEKLADITAQNFYQLFWKAA